MMEKDLLLSLYSKAVEGVMPGPLVARSLRDLPWQGPMRLLAVGKGAGSMAFGAQEVVGEAVVDGLVVLPPGVESPGRWRRIEGGHPLPSRGSLEAGEAALELAREAGEEGLFLVLLSGGASALMEVPWPGLSLEELVETTRALLVSGATIGEINTVRKHLSTLKGGRLAQAAAPSRVLTLILSDVVGDPLDVIGSGPTYPDATTFAQALEVLERRGCLPSVPSGVVDHLRRGVAGEVPETPKGHEPFWRGVRHRILGNNRKALETAAREAAKRRIEAVIYTSRLKGEAREVAKVLAAVAWDEAHYGTRPRLLLWGGEPTVTVRGRGKGGRAQEMALALALELEGWPGTFLAAGTDGIDGMSPAAGAFGDGTTVARARARGLDPEAYLEENDSYNFFRILGDLLVTGPTGTNVMDVVLFYLPGG